LLVRGLLDNADQFLAFAGDRSIAKRKRFMPVSSLAVCAGVFGGAVTEIHEILA
jgi:hypothetical protein